MLLLVIVHIHFFHFTILFTQENSQNKENMNVKSFTVIFVCVIALLSITGEAGYKQHNETKHNRSYPQLYMQAYEIAGDNIIDLLTTRQSTQTPTVLETAEKGTHVAVCH